VKITPGRPARFSPEIDPDYVGAPDPDAGRGTSLHQEWMAGELKWSRPLPGAGRTEADKSKTRLSALLFYATMPLIISHRRVAESKADVISHR